MPDIRELSQLIIRLWNEEPGSVRAEYERRCDDRSAQTQAQERVRPSQRGRRAAASRGLTAAVSPGQYSAIPYHQHSTHPKRQIYTADYTSVSAFLANPPSFDCNAPRAYFDTAPPTGPVQISLFEYPASSDGSTSYYGGSPYPFGHPEMSHLADQVATRAFPFTNLDFSLENALVASTSTPQGPISAPVSASMPTAWIHSVPPGPAPSNPTLDQFLARFSSPQLDALHGYLESYSGWERRSPYQTITGNPRGRNAVQSRFHRQWHIGGKVAGRGGT
ncbi:hypothetical protein DFP72DRAFT_850645 [Ephemerocybe angulata]|uniref:Uncharacterized protein n=1 Tax=Ephemerocybe angulata TaxID=980116 RepID=A0A8H6M4U4_9AGAR|nr:hypothetical protein DFP72DRAFT_853028 [Tulosesus angulatus]KAF6751517.1 hypothetical protein DFP72DRAFT_850645 [Tulosesus angulatus]